MILKQSFNDYSLKTGDASDLVLLMVEHLPSWLTASCLNVFPRAFLTFFCPSALWGKTVREGVEGLEAHQRSRGVRSDRRGERKGSKKERRRTAGATLLNAQTKTNIHQPEINLLKGSR